MSDRTLPTPDLAWLRKGLEWAEAEAAKPYPECEWQQDNYGLTEEATAEKGKTCGTCGCIAWHIDRAAGRDSAYIDVSASASQLLGLTPYEAHELFRGDNDIEDLRHVAEGIAARAGERL